MQASEQVYRLRKQKLSWRTVGDEVVVLDLERSVYLSLNASGRELWLRLADGAERPQLVAALRDAFEITADAAERDVAEFLDELIAHDLLA